ncbi:amidohydrolase [Pantoea sp. Ap-967]|uniref:amidohydrolase family protein n=1 Tax=Pantoea sp. Ap-967 TaxID=2608362 RepID=UPI001423B630|nr:amidohydrolase family protein [Pantoea sp. Ap-967]
MSNSPHPVVDTHAHAFHRGLSFVDSRRFTPRYDAAYSDYIAQLDQHGSDYGVLVALSILGTDNSYMLECLARAEGRLRGVVAIDPATDFKRLDDYSKAGVVGIRINLTGNLPIPDFCTPAWRQIIGFCRDQGWHIEINDRCDRLPLSVQPLIDSGVFVVVDHFAMPDSKLGINSPGFQWLLQAAESRLVWLKLSGAFRFGPTIADQAAPQLIKAFGPDRLLWASDWPFTQHESSESYALQVERRQAWLPTAELQRQVLWETPARLFQF